MLQLLYDSLRKEAELRKSQTDEPILEIGHEQDRKTNNDGHRDLSLNNADSSLGEIGPPLQFGMAMMVVSYCFCCTSGF